MVGSEKEMCRAARFAFLAYASAFVGEHHQEERHPRNLILILAREFALKLATPMFIADDEGRLVFYNEPAEEVLGRPYSDAGEMAAGEWGELFQIEDLEGSPLPLEAMPAGVAFRERRPAHGGIRITGLDGKKRELAVTAFPLFSREREFVGVVAIFWEQPVLPFS